MRFVKEIESLQHKKEIPKEIKQSVQNSESQVILFKNFKKKNIAKNF